MASPLLQSKKKSFALLFVISLSLIACKFEPLKIDPCAIDSPDLKSCYAVPINQDKEPYERDINLGDICITSDEYSELVKYNERILKACGKRCR